MADAGFFKGTSADQDRRFSDKEVKLLKSMKFPSEFDKKVDMRKVNLTVIRPWIAKKVVELVGFEDEVVVEYAMGLLEDKQQPTPDPKKMQINLTGFLTKETPAFMTALWKLLLEAQEDVTGVPRSFVEEKKAEMKRARESDSRVFDERDRRAGRLDELSDRGFIGRGRGRGRGRGGGGGRGRGGYGYDDRDNGRSRDSGWGGRGGRGGPPPRRRFSSRSRSRSRSPPPRRRSRSRTRSASLASSRSRSRTPLRKYRFSPSPRRPRSRSPSYTPPPRRRRDSRSPPPRRRRLSPSQSPPPRRRSVSPRARSRSRSPKRKQRSRRDYSPSPTPPRRDSPPPRRRASPPRRSLTRSHSRSLSPRMDVDLDGGGELKIKGQAKKSKWDDDVSQRQTTDEELLRRENELKEKALRNKVVRTRKGSGST